MPLNPRHPSQSGYPFLRLDNYWPRLLSAEQKEKIISFPPSFFFFIPNQPEIKLAKDILSLLLFFFYSKSTRSKIGEGWEKSRWKGRMTGRFSRSFIAAFSGSLGAFSRVHAPHAINFLDLRR